VEVIRYATRQSYDSRMWQTIEFKAAAIEQFRRGDLLVRVIDDVGGEAANAAEMKAAATGNPLILMQVKLAADLKKLEAVFANHQRNLHALQNRVAWLNGASQRAEAAATMWSAEIQRRDQHTQAPFKLETPTASCGEQDKEVLMTHVLTAMKQALERRAPSAPGSAPMRVHVGRYRGFELEVFARQDEVQFALTGATSHEPDNLRYGANDTFSLTGFISRQDNYLGRLESLRDQAHTTCQEEQLEHERVLTELTKPFAQQAALEALRADMRDVMVELKRMQTDDAYVSSWRPRATGHDEQPCAETVGTVKAGVRCRG
jgi:hypothetical protein